ncbi:MAG TPA: secretin N-terminal domain-containing protein [Candidatus Omnitrophota bacterium]|nr:secretin N-terminal domain-containing protein [Candidatus Omnitrophota bacterium]HPT39612.1 secretin N-terminal domain-containing protein [Candidatus Omnitrophota bacterium]
MKIIQRIFIFIILVCLTLFYKVQAEDQSSNLAQAAVSSPAAAPSVPASAPVSSDIPATPASASQNPPAAPAAVIPEAAAPAAIKVPEAVEPIAGGMNGRISLDLRNIEVTDALKFLSIKTGVNMISTKDVSGRVTLMVLNVPARDVFDIMLRSNGLAYTKEGEIYNIMSGDEYKALFGKKFADIREVKVFRIKYAIPEQVFAMLDALKSEIGRVLVEPDSGTALIMDTPEKIAEIEKALSTLEQKNLVRVFQLKYAKAKDVEEQLKAQLDTKKVGTIKADERSNQVIVQTLPERMVNIEKMIASLDQKTKQVLIDSTIIKVKVSDQLETGAEWEGLLAAASEYGMAYFGANPFSVIKPTTMDTTNTYQSRYDYLTKTMNNNIGSYPSTGNTESSSATSKTGPGVLHLGIIDSKRDVDIILKYVQTLGNTQILSNPKISIVNNQEAKIHVGERQAYVTSTTTTGQSTSTVSEEVTFVDVGIQLSVTPTINEDGYVTMKIKPEISSVVSFLDTPSGNKIPIIDTSMSETTVMVKDGSTIIIGGLRREDKTAATEQFPFLGNIPFIGYFFKNKTAKTEKTELLVMITPHITTGDILVTGDRREPRFHDEPNKEYNKYESFGEKPDFKEEEAPEKKISPKGAPEDEVKSYREYPSFKPEQEYQPTFKGDASNE